MAVRIRVYPQNGALGMAGGAVSAQTYYTQKLQTQQQVSNLRLGYERALFNEKLDKVRLEERLKNPYLAAGAGMAGALALPGAVGFGGMPALGTMGALPMAGLPMGMPFGGVGAMPLNALAGSGQANVTNQSSPGSASQSVSNVNTYNSSNVMPNPYAMGGWGRPFGSGGFLSGLLGALI